MYIVRTALTQSAAKLTEFANSNGTWLASLSAISAEHSELQETIKKAQQDFAGNFATSEKELGTIKEDIEERGEQIKEVIDCLIIFNVKINDNKMGFVISDSDGLAKSHRTIEAI